MIDPAPAGDVVVGVDGSTSSFLAVDWAAAEAARRGCGLTVVHAWQFPHYHVPLDSPVVSPEHGGLQAAAERVLADAVARAEAAAPGVVVTGRLVSGGAAGAMTAIGSAASLLVLGSRGLGGVTGLLVGSVGVQVSAHAACPVIVLRRHEDIPAPPHAGRVLVGVDGSDAARAALAFAFDEADRMGVGLVAATVYQTPTLVAEGGAYVGPSAEDLAEGARRLLEREVAPLRERYPAVAVDLVPKQSSTGWALVTEAAGCELLVVGSRGHGGFAGLLLGSVSQYALHHARCPVAVVRAPHPAAQGS